MFEEYVVQLNMYAKQSENNKIRPDFHIMNYEQLNLMYKNFYEYNTYSNNFSYPDLVELDFYEKWLENFKW